MGSSLRISKVSSICIVLVLLICQIRHVAAQGNTNNSLSIDMRPGQSRIASNVGIAKSALSPKTVDLTTPGNYFSGTDNDWILKIWVPQPTNGVTLADATVYLIGQDYQGNPINQALISLPGGGPFTSWTTEVIFDSSHFAATEPLTLRIIGHSSQGVEGRYDRTFPSKNLALVYHEQYQFTSKERTHFGSGDNLVNFIADCCGMDNYKPRTIGDNNPWTGAQIASALKFYNIFFEFAHGNDDHFEDSKGTDAGSITFISAKNYPNVTDNVNAKGLDNPPYELVNADSCWSCGTLDQTVPQYSKVGAAAFGVGRSDDQAFWGWGVLDTTTYFNVDWVQRAWRYLAAGYNLGAATDMATKGGHPRGGGEPWDSPTWMKPINPIRYGDLRTRLHGVYTDNDTEQTLPAGNQITDWWRVISSSAM